MRFEQLKRSPNVIVKKRLYKSGKNWVVMSTLSFIGGAILLGASQTNIVKADVDPNASGTVAEQVQPSNSPSVDSENATKTQNGASDAGEGTVAEEKNGQGQSPAPNAVYTPKVTKDSDDIKPAPDAQGVEQTTSEHSDEDYTVSNIAKPTDGVQNTSLSELPNNDTSDGDIDSGDGWKIDSNHKLHFTTSNTDLNMEGAPKAWQDTKYTYGSDAVTSISFDDDITAGKSLNSLFSGFTHVTSITGLEKLHTENTTDFSFMFSACESLDPLDVSTLDVSNGLNFSYMFFRCLKLTSIKMPALHSEYGSDFSAMFQNDSALKSLDISNFDMSKAEYGAPSIFLQNNLYSLRLGKNTKLTPAPSGLDKRTNTNEKNVKWTSDKSDKSYSSTDLANLYTGSNGIETTWNVSFVHFKVKYIDSSDNTITYTDPTNYYAPADSDFTINGFPIGYEPINDDTSVIVPSENNDIATLYTKLTPKTADKLIVKESYQYGNKSKIDRSFQLPINGVLNQYFKSSELMNGGKNWDNIDFNNSYIILYNFNAEKDKIGDFKDQYEDKCKSLEKKPSIGDFISSNFTSHNVSSNSLINANIPVIEYDIVYKNNKPVHHSSTPTSEITDFNQNISTFGDRPAVQEYNDYGNAIDDKIAPNTDWHSDKKMVRNGITYYSVNDDTWVKDSDVYIYFVNNADVRTYQGKFVPLTDGDNSKTLDRGLQAGSDWYTDRIALLNGDKYYRVATSEFVKATAVYEYKAEPQTIQTNKNTTVYDELGNVVNIKLPFSEYKSDINMTINGVTYYRIATNLFVKQA